MESPPRDHGIAGSARRGAIMGKEAREHVEGPPAPTVVHTAMSLVLFREELLDDSPLADAVAA